MGSKAKQQVAGFTKQIEDKEVHEHSPATDSANELTNARVAVERASECAVKAENAYTIAVADLRTAQQTYFEARFNAEAAAFKVKDASLALPHLPTIARWYDGDSEKATQTLLGLCKANGVKAIGSVITMIDKLAAKGGNAAALASAMI